MPLYEYICENCGKEIEVLQKITEDALTQCPSCKQEGLRKQTSKSAFHLKGGGWYKDGYNATDTEKANGTAASGDNATKPDQKSDKKEKESAKKSDKKTSAASSKTADSVPSSKAS